MQDRSLAGRLLCFGLLALLVLIETVHDSVESIMTYAFHHHVPHEAGMALSNSLQFR